MSRHRFLFFRFNSLLLCAVALLVLSVNQPGFSQPKSIPPPRDVLGFNPGDDRTIADWKQISDYFTRLDRASDRVRVEALGKSTMGRPLFAAFISAPENIRQLEKYKTIQARLADPATIKSDAERDLLIRNGKTVVAISCSIHSTEIVASQMSLQLAYELATAMDSDTREILQQTILILIPSPNPDGIDIVADWYRKTLGTPFEGKEPPELYHYYAGHDDNRDWFMLNLRETRLINTLFWKSWFPQIVYDVHQQGQTGSRFFIPPFYDPPNPNISPLLLRQVGLLGHKMAADLQAKEYKGVITNALYDTWWHGGFRTAPYYHNSIGILSEAASARLMTPVDIKSDQLAKSSTRGMSSALEPATNFPDPWPGGHWRPRDVMQMELVGSRSILSMAARFRKEYLTNFLELGRANLKGENGSKPLAYMIPAGQGNDLNVARMIDALVSQAVEVKKLDSELHTRYGDQKDFVETPAGSFIVFTSQPTGANVRSLFEKQVYPDRRGARGEAERPYDVVGWTLPMQMGVEAVPVWAIREPEDERDLSPVESAADVLHEFGLEDFDATDSERRTPFSIPNPLKKNVRVALYKSWTGSMDEGWTRFVFDSFNLPFKSLYDKEIRNGRLRENFDVIVLPSMRMKEIVEGNPEKSYPAEYTGGITDAGVQNLKRFVEEGGTIICFDASSELAIKRFGLPVKNVLEGLKSSEFYCPGSILKLDVDTSSSIAAGLPRQLDAYFINSSAFEATDPARVKVIARYAGSGLLQSGWLLGEEKLAGKIALAEVPLGKGQVILFAFRPQHRGQTWGTFPFIWNALQESGAAR